MQGKDDALITVAGFCRDLSSMAIEILGGGGVEMGLKLDWKDHSRKGSGEKN